MAFGDVPIKITFVLVDEDKFETIERNFTRDTTLFDCFKIIATADTINIAVPHQILPYLYGADHGKKKNNW